MDLNLVPNIKHTKSNNFFLLAGPCAIEGEEMALRIAEHILKVTDKLEIPFVFKGSFKISPLMGIAALYPFILSMFSKDIPGQTLFAIFLAMISLPEGSKDAIRRKLFQEGRD